VFDIVCFLTDFHQDVGDISIDFLKPGVFFIQLIAKDQTENFFARHVAQTSGLYLRAASPEDFPARVEGSAQEAVVRGVNRAGPLTSGLLIDRAIDLSMP
jgi:hypothetical protein